MASLSQERLQMNRALLDNWSTREQLCLASAVSCSGDQNWMSVSRNLKLVCGNNNREGSNRPADWFSQKSCALQYAHLLENVETPKRKKRSSENNSRVSSPSTMETPTESVLRRLTEERIQELKVEIRKGQEEYAKIHAELQKIQSPNLSDEALREMWRIIELEQDAQRITEMKLENQMREREQRRQELQRSWRQGGAGSTINTISLKQQENTTVVDMDVEEIIGVSKPIIPVQQQTAPSPLLSSLLKSPTATVPPATPNMTSSARTTAPTITTLLTSGSIPNTNQPAITLNTDFIPPEKAVQLLTRPISGPPVGDSSNLSTTAAHTLLSPSQSAPTLSMLLEKNKPSFSSNNTQHAVTEVSTDHNSCFSKSKVAECNKTDESMEIDEDVNSQPNKNESEANVESDEPDPNEEQQLLEVFKNIGNIELDIDVSAVIDDEEVDFLKGVDEESPSGTAESVDFASKVEGDPETTAPQTQKEPADEKRTEEASLIKAVKPENESLTNQKEIKVETSSDDSNDNIPLAAVVTLENKERSLATPTAESEEKSKDNDFLKVKVESAIKNQDQLDKLSTIQVISPVKVEVVDSIKEETLDDEEEVIDKSETKDDDVEDIFEETTDEIEQEGTNEKTSEEEETHEVEPERFATPTCDEKIQEKDIHLSEDLLAADKERRQVDVSHIENDSEPENVLSNAPLSVDEEAGSIIVPNQANTNANDTLLTSAAPPSASNQNIVADTDEDSTDVSVVVTTTRREDNLGTSTSFGTKHSSERNASHTRKAGSHETASKSTEDFDSSSGNRSLKRSLLNILGTLCTSKSAQIIQRTLCDEQFKPKYYNTCNRRIDFETLKKSIENGSIRSIIDLQRNLLQITTNISLLCQPSSAVYKATQTFKHEMQNVREFVANPPEIEIKVDKEVKEVKHTTGKQGRTGSRKSLRIS